MSLGTKFRLNVSVSLIIWIHWNRAAWWWVVSKPSHRFKVWGSNPGSGLCVFFPPNIWKTNMLSSSRNANKIEWYWKRIELRLRWNMRLLFQGALRTCPLDLLNTLSCRPLNIEYFTNSYQTKHETQTRPYICSFPPPISLLCPFLRSFCHFYVCKQKQLVKSWCDVTESCHRFELETTFPMKPFQIRPSMNDIVVCIFWECMTNEWTGSRTFFAQETLPETEAEGQHQESCHRGHRDEDGQGRPNYEWGHDTRV